MQSNANKIVKQVKKRFWGDNTHTMKNNGVIMVCWSHESDTEYAPLEIKLLAISYTLSLQGKREDYIKCIHI